MGFSWRKVLAAMIVCLLCAICLDTLFSQKIAELSRHNAPEKWNAEEIYIPVKYGFTQAYRLTDPDGNDYVLIMTSDGPTITSIPKSEGGK